MEETNPQEPAPEAKEWTLNPQSEYRFELDPDVTLAIQLVAGRAEIFGAEIALGRTYIFGNECKAAIFTWHGCTIEMSKPLRHCFAHANSPLHVHVRGQPSTEYVSDETPMVPYSNLHIALEKMRILAKNQPQAPQGTYGSNLPESPRVMVIGPENSGKTSACKTLVNYAVRSARVCTPILVNVDPSEGGWTVPGTVSACVITSPLPTSTPANSFGSAATSAPTALPSSALIPIVYWYGHSDPKRNKPMMERSIQNLAKAVKQRMDLDPLAQNSGLYIDTPSTFATPQRVGSELRYPFIEHCVVQFDVNVIIVIGHEKLNVDIQRLFGSSSRKINIIKVAKSGGVVDLDWQYRSRLLSYQIRAYFYGPLLHVPSWIDQSTLGGETSADLTLSPYSSPIKFNEIKILRIGAESMAPSSALPIGATRVITELEPTSVDLRSPGLLNTLLALMPIQPNQTAGAMKAEDEYSNDELITSDVAGFVLVTAVDAAKDKLTILSPNPGSLVGRTAIIGSLEWQDQ